MTIDCDTTGDPDPRAAGPRYLGNRPRVGRDGDRDWRDPNGQLHRVDGPAVEWSDGEKQWWFHGHTHNAPRRMSGDKAG